jgi:hypothetical protein
MCSEFKAKTWDLEGQEGRERLRSINIDLSDAYNQHYAINKKVA